MEQEQAAASILSGLANDVDSRTLTRSEQEITPEQNDRKVQRKKHKTKQFNLTGITKKDDMFLCTYRCGKQSVQFRTDKVLHRKLVMTNTPTLNEGGEK